ncbi:MAG: rhomboid family intramembrane serine protease [Prochloraceae cyanobacterium]|nr:rhomboid family intramembrane serine protease [Prochloraceae cyanobacterium]
MVPIHDENPTKITPYITYILIVINVLVFLHQITLSDRELQGFFQLYALVPREFTATLEGITVNQPVPEWSTLVTSQFLHGSWMHLGGNMLFLWIFGNNIEEQLGRLKYLLFYLSCGVLAGLTQWFFSINSIIPSLGASGAIAGVMGAYILRFPKTKILTLIPVGIIIPVKIPAYFFLGIWFLQQALYSVLSLDVPNNIGMESGGIAYWAHAGGFVFGAILGPLLGLFSRKKRR